MSGLPASADAASRLLPSQCGACGEAGQMHHAFEKWGIDILECGVCRSAQASIPDTFDPRSIYSEDYFQGGQRDGYADYVAAEPVMRREFRSALKILRRSGCRDGKLLEIGCAYGYFMNEARPYFQCTGVEVSEAARQRASALGEVVAADLSSPEVAARGPYDALVMIDCIEHLADPYGVVQDATAMTAEKASIMVVTGDWASPLARRTRDRWRLMTPPQHLYFFSRDGLERLLVRCGYRVTSWQRPWRQVSAGLAAYQLTHRLGMDIQLPASLNRLPLPLKLYDGMRVIAQRT